FGRSATDIGARAGAETLGNTQAELTFAVGARLGERLGVRVGDQELDPAKRGPDHVLDRVAAGAADADDQDAGFQFGLNLGHGNIDFEEIIRALNRIKYHGPLSVEWEDSGMDREHGAAEACEFVRNIDFPPSDIAFDAAFDD
ncbi:MAG: hypothetical protein HOD37_06010, partial [Bacteroidetes bacterium]|nr:hypothetical protein [Bacteroidota bacterium]